MTAAVDITAQAKQVDVGRVLLTALAGALFAIGWVPAKLCLAVVWSCVAVKVGWQTAWDRNRPGSSG